MANQIVFASTIKGNNTVAVTNNALEAGLFGYADQSSTVAVRDAMAYNQTILASAGPSSIFPNWANLGGARVFFELYFHYNEAETTKQVENTPDSFADPTVCHLHFSGSATTDLQIENLAATPVYITGVAYILAS